MFIFILLLSSTLYGIEAYHHYAMFEMEIGNISPAYICHLSKAESYRFHIKAKQIERTLSIESSCPIEFSFDGLEETPCESILTGDENCKPLSNANTSIFQDFQFLQPTNLSIPKNNHIKSVSSLWEILHRKKRLSITAFQKKFKKIQKKFILTPNKNEFNKDVISLVIPKIVDVDFSPIYDQDKEITFGPLILNFYESNHIPNVHEH